jgi:ATP-binding cassette subfamily B protein
MTVAPSLPDRFPAAWRAAVLTELQPQEVVVAWLECDLDRQLRFASGLVLLTDRRLLASAGDADGKAWQAWPLHTGLRVRHFDHAGIGTLELCDSAGRIA